MKKIINSAEQMLKVTRRIDQGRGVLYTYGNAPADTRSSSSSSCKGDFQWRI